MSSPKEFLYLPDEVYAPNGCDRAVAISGGSSSEIGLLVGLAQSHAR
jgi:hypothetical protein